MTHYRLYYLDSADHIMAAEDLVAPDDVDALDQAKDRLGDRTLLLWQAARQVARINPEDAPRTLN